MDANFNSHKAKYAAVINCSIDGKPYSLIINTVDETNINSSATLSEHPIPNGTMAADHIFAEPTSLTLSGSFPYLKNDNGMFEGIKLENEDGYFGNIEELFERIKNEGILCEIVKISFDETDQKISRFLRRTSMALTSITWVEGISALKFTFSFRQVQTINIAQATVDESDEYLPNVNMPQSLSFSETLLDMNSVWEAVANAMDEADAWTQGFKDWYKSLNRIVLGGAALTASAAFLAVVISGATFTGVGLLIVASVVGLTCIVNAISNAIKTHKNRFKRFEYYRNNAKMQQEKLRFDDFCENIQSTVKLIDQSVSVFGFNADEDQTCLLNINNEYYSFEFTKNSISKTYDLRVSNESEKVVLTNISNINSNARADFTTCDKTSKALVDYNICGQYVYLVCGNEGSNDLQDYYIVVSTVKPSEISNEVDELVKTAFLL